MSTLVNFSEGVQCSQHKEFTNFLKLFDKLKLFYGLFCSGAADSYSDMIYQYCYCLSGKGETLKVYKHWSFSFMLSASPLNSWSRLLIKLDTITWCVFYVSYSLISFSNFFTLLSVLISFEIPFVSQCKW